jgi:Flagellar motor protein
MSSSNPFTQQPARTRSNRGAVIAASLFGLIAAGLGLWVMKVSNDVRVQDRLLASTLDERDALVSALAGATNHLHEAREEITSLNARIAELEAEKEKVATTAQTLESEMRAALESKEVTISELQGRLTLNILDNVMFDSGEAVLKPGGEAVMQKVAAFLAERPELKIHVIGHTDNIPIRADSRNRFASNWELSAARALAAVHFLTEQAGMDPRRVGALAYGEHHPVADNATAEGRAKNRRIEIAILPLERPNPPDLASGTPH